MSADNRVRVLVIDDHEIVRRGVVDVVDADPQLTVVAEAGTVLDAIRRAAAVRPDVAIVDLKLPDGTGIDVVRALRKETQALIVRRLNEVVDSLSRLHDAKIDLEYIYGVPCTFNADDETEHAVAAARDVAGAANVDPATLPTMAGEDFSLMLERRPGAMIFIGNGDSAGLHHPAYDFDVRAIPAGVSYWSRLAEMRMPAA